MGSNRLAENKKILIVGTARNCFGYLEDNISRIFAAFQEFSNIHWLIVESDSSDDTLLLLSRLALKIPNFQYKSLGYLEATIPLRTERIAYCRNYYLNEIQTNIGYADVDLLVVCDLDKNAQSHLTKEGVMSCFERIDWDVCTSNQLGKYYDIWALRHSLWSPNDCWQQNKFLQSSLKLPKKKAMYAAIYSRMIQITPESDWIAVDSAFGGLGIYKVGVIKSAQYVGKFKNEIGEPDQVCEHVAFHDQLIQNGARIFINPKLINTSTNEHSVQSIVPGELKLDIEPEPTAVLPQLLNVSCTHEDVIAAYKLFFGRLPTAKDELSKNVGKSSDSLIAEFLFSKEFLVNEDKRRFIFYLANKIKETRKVFNG